MYNGEKLNVQQFIADAVAEIKAQVGSDVVVLGLSGGVDSTVTALLVDKAIGKKLVCIFVDHGLLRKTNLRTSSSIMRVWDSTSSACVPQTVSSRLARALRIPS